MSICSSQLSGEKVQEHHLRSQVSSTHLDRVNIVSDDNELSLLLLHESGDGVNTVSHHGSSLAGGVLLPLSPGGGSLSQPLLLGLLGLRPVLVQQLEELGGCRIQGQYQKRMIEKDTTVTTTRHSLPCGAVIALSRAASSQHEAVMATCLLCKSCWPDRHGNTLSLAAGHCNLMLETSTTPVCLSRWL